MLYFNKEKFLRSLKKALPGVQVKIHSTKEEAKFLAPYISRVELAKKLSQEIVK